MIINSGEVNISKPTGIKVTREENKLKEQRENPERPKEKIESVEIFDDGKELSFGSIKKEWQKVLKIIKDKKINIYALLVEGKLISFINNNLCIGYKDGFGFHRDAINKPNNKKFVEKTVSSYFNKNINIDFIMDDEQVIENIEKTKEKEDTIQEVIDFFGKDIVEIK